VRAKKETTLRVISKRFETKEASRTPTDRKEAALREILLEIRVVSKSFGAATIVKPEVVGFSPDL
jgi:hypothetical protein